MNFSTITVLIFFFYYIRQQAIFGNYQARLRYKYKAQTWHTGFFADLKLKRMLDAEDKVEYKLKSKKLSKLLLYFLLYTILIFMISGLLFNGKL